jgi:hypothetical protein
VYVLPAVCNGFASSIEICDIPDRNQLKRLYKTGNRTKLQGRLDQSIGEPMITQKLLQERSNY